MPMVSREMKWRPPINNGGRWLWFWNILRTGWKHACWPSSFLGFCSVQLSSQTIRTDGRTWFISICVKHCVSLLTNIILQLLKSTGSRAIYITVTRNWSLEYYPVLSLTTGQSIHVCDPKSDSVAKTESSIAYISVLLPVKMNAEESPLTKYRPYWKIHDASVPR